VNHTFGFGGSAFLDDLGDDFILLQKTLACIVGFNPFNNT
jgi:hypothetical protein